MFPSPSQMSLTSLYVIVMIEPSLFHISFPPFHRMQFTTLVVLGDFCSKLLQAKAWPLAARFRPRPKTSEYPKPSRAEQTMSGVGIFSLAPPVGGLRSSLQVVFASCRGCFLRLTG